MESFSTFQQPENRGTPLLDWLVGLIEDEPNIQRTALQKRRPNSSNIDKVIQSAIAKGLIKPDGDGGYVCLKSRRPVP
jgi:hypothetical protein